MASSSSSSPGRAGPTVSPLHSSFTEAKKWLQEWNIRILEARDQRGKRKKIHGDNVGFPLELGNHVMDWGKEENELR